MDPKLWPPSVFVTVAKLIIWKHKSNFVFTTMYKFVFICVIVFQVNSSFW